MSELVLAGAAVALLGLIFSDLPFISLVYMIAIGTVVDWDQWAVITGIAVIAHIGGTVWRKLR